MKDNREEVVILMLVVLTVAVLLLTSYTANSPTGAVTVQDLGIFAQTNATLEKLSTGGLVQFNATVNYSVQLNISNGNATNISCNETYPAGFVFLQSSPTTSSGNNIWSLGNVSAGFNTTINISMSATPFPCVVSAELLNRVNCSFVNETGGRINLSASVATNVPCVLSNLTVNKTDTPDPVNAGATLSYNITINVTNGSATNVTVNDSYPSEVTFVSAQPTPDVGTNNQFFSLGTLYAQTVFVVNISVTVNSSLANATVINNSVNVTWINLSAVTINTTAQANTTVNASAPVVTNFTLAKAGLPVIVNGSDWLNYSITINITNGTANNITLFESYPSGVTFVSSQPGAVSGSSNLNFSVGNLTNASFIVNITVNVSTSIVNGSTITNTVNVTFTNQSSSPQSAVATALNTVLNPVAVASAAGQGGGGPAVAHWVPWVEVPPKKQFPLQVMQELQVQMMTPLNYVSVENSGCPGNATGLNMSQENKLIACACIINATNQTSSIETIIDSKFSIPTGYELIGQPVSLKCNNDDVDMTFNVPNHFVDVELWRCSSDNCRNVSRIVSDDLVCGGIAVEQARRTKTVESTQKLIVVEKQAQTINETQRVLVSGSAQINFVGEIKTPFGVEVASEDVTQSIENSTVGLLATPIVLLFKGEVPKNVGARAEIAFIPAQGYASSNFAVFVRKQGDWIQLANSYDAKRKRVIFDTRDVRDWIDAKKITLVLLGITNPNVWAKENATLEQVYNPKSRNAVVFVHGFGARAAWQPLIDELRLTNQPVQAWLFTYSTSISDEENAQALAELLEKNSQEYDRVVLVGHSLGSLITQQAIKDAQGEGLPVLNKIQKVVLIAGPNEGTPTLERLRNVWSNFFSQNIVLSFLNMNSDVYNDLLNGRHVPKVSGVKYYVIAGTQPYWFTSELFTEGDVLVKNDGIVSRKSAQHIGDDFANKFCDNYAELQLSHMDLDAHPTARHFIERQFASMMKEDNGELGIVGFNQYLETHINNCSQSDTLYLIGKRIDDRAAVDPTHCSCGNGVCGVDETAESCPSDCAKPKSIEAQCIFLLIPIGILIIILFALITVLFIRRYVYAKKDKKEWYIVQTTLIIAAIIMTIYQYNFCKPRILALYLCLAYLVVIIIIDYVLNKD